VKWMRSQSKLYAVVPMYVNKHSFIIEHPCSGRPSCEPLSRNSATQPDVRSHPKQVPLFETDCRIAPQCFHAMINRSAKSDEWAAPALSLR